MVLLIETILALRRRLRHCGAKSFGGVPVIRVLLPVKGIDPLLVLSSVRVLGLLGGDWFRVEECRTRTHHGCGWTLLNERLPLSRPFRWR